MRLFHISEEDDIQVFEPRKSYRQDLKDSPPLVWAVNEKCLVNFLTPRECPRLTYHLGADTSLEDQKKFFSSHESNHVVVIEKQWLNRLQHTTLYVYEMETSHFKLQDSIAGYYVSEQTERPIALTSIDDLMKELMDRNVEVRIVPSLWKLRTDIINSSLNYSLCRLKNANGADLHL